MNWENTEGSRIGSHSDKGAAFCHLFLFLTFGKGVLYPVSRHEPREGEDNLSFIFLIGLLASVISYLNYQRCSALSLGGLLSSNIQFEVRCCPASVEVSYLAIPFAPAPVFVLHSNNTQVCKNPRLELKDFWEIVWSHQSMYQTVNQDCEFASCHRFISFALIQPPKWPDDQGILCTLLDFLMWVCSEFVSLARYWCGLRTALPRGL